MGRSSWINPAGPKYNHMFLEERGRGRFDTSTQRRESWCEDRGRDWSDVEHKPRNAGGHQTLEEARNRFPLESLEEMWSCFHPDSGHTHMHTYVLYDMYCMKVRMCALTP